MRRAYHLPFKWQNNRFSSTFALRSLKISAQEVGAFIGIRLYSSSVTVL